MHFCSVIVALTQHSLELFVEACGQLLNKLTNLELSVKEQWMEKIFVSVIWTLTNTNSSEDHDPSLAETAAQLLTDSGLHEPSEDATQASLVVSHSLCRDVSESNKTSSSGSISTQ
jgi:hypothetical protein